MKAQETNNNLSSIERLVAKYDQQDTTAQNCGFASYIDMLVNFESTDIEYSVLTQFAALGYILLGYTTRN